MIAPEVFTLIGIFLVALLYSSVGHGGASGYIAVLSLLGWAPTAIRPLALLLNILVSAVAFLRFFEAGYFRLRLFLPVVILSVPAAALGAYLKVPPSILAPVLGLVLCASAVWLVLRKEAPTQIRPPSVIAASATGTLLGFLAGVTGTGGGIFLSPVMYFFGWASLKEISAVAAPYILVNSLAGFLGTQAGGSALPANWQLYVLAALVGGMAGSFVGVKLLDVRGIRWLLAAVLSVAGLKFFFR